jgi:NAD(P)H-dependent FMN reductase
MARLIGIAGSLRSGSINRALLRAAADNMPRGSELVIADIGQIPLYNGDVEDSEGIPAAVSRLQDQIAGSDGLVIATPEYNSGMPGVLKNVMDWLSRPPEQIGRVFRGRPVAIMGASPGGFGTVSAQGTWLPVLKTLGARTWSGGRMLVSGAGKVFDEDGQLIDDSVRKRLASFMADFVEFVGS